jgi:hypothetical protein
MGKRIFEGLGPGTLIPQRGQLPNVDTSIGAEEGFVLSRVDGQTSLDQILLLVPFDEPVTMVILRRLWERGAIEVPGVARSIAPKKERTPEPVLVPTPQAAAGGDLPPEQKKRIDGFYDSLTERDAFQLLEVERGADDKAIKRAYFKLSKEFHPDRFFGRDIGVYREKLSQIFQAVKAAFELLSSKERRAAYEDSAK